jgi:hypothetical protein
VAGEDFLSFVKRYMRRGLQQGWQKNLLTFLLRDKAIMNIFNNTTEPDEGDIKDAGEWWHSEFKQEWSEKKGYHCYKSLENLIQHLLIGYPISVIILDVNLVCAIIREKTFDHKVMIQLKRERFHSLVNDLAYREWKVDTGLATEFDVLETDWGCGSLLPLLTKTKSFPPNIQDMRFAMVDEEWRELTESGSYSY